MVGVAVASVIVGLITVGLLSISPGILGIILDGISGRNGLIVDLNSPSLVLYQLLYYVLEAIKVLSNILYLVLDRYSDRLLGIDRYIG